MKVALVHDDFCQLGGAERLFAEIAKIYPNAPIYTSLVSRDKIPVSISLKRIHISFIQKIPFAQKFYKVMLPFYPLAFESFNFNEFDLVISSTTRFAKAIITAPNTKHVCYINSIPRFLYNGKTQKQYLPQLALFFIKPYLNWLKKWDKASSSRVDLYIANSKNVQKQIKDKYNRDSVVIYPAVSTEFFKPNNQAMEQSNNQKYYLVVSRLNKWKRLDIAIRAACELGVNLKIVGTGPDEQRLKQILNQVQNDSREGARPFGQTQGKQTRTIKNKIAFLGNITKEELRDLYQNAKALIVTQEEDFGIVMAEAQACGIPVIAFKKGGASEIIIDGKTGLFFNLQTANSLKDAIFAQSTLKWDIGACRKIALKFSKAAFVNNLKKSIDDYASQTH